MVGLVGLAKLVQVGWWTVNKKKMVVELGTGVM
jgi:hypothetical protein